MEQTKYTGTARYVWNTKAHNSYATTRVAHCHSLGTGKSTPTYGRTTKSRPMARSFDTRCAWAVWSCHAVSDKWGNNSFCSTHTNAKAPPPPLGFQHTTATLNYVLNYRVVTGQPQAHTSCVALIQCSTAVRRAAQAWNLVGFFAFKLVVIRHLLTHFDGLLGKQKDAPPTGSILRASTTIQRRIAVRVARMVHVAHQAGSQSRIHNLQKKNKRREKRTRRTMNERRESTQPTTERRPKPMKA